MSLENNRIEITFVRHGKTEFNLNNKMQGWSNSELLEESIDKAKRLGNYFNVSAESFDAFYASDSKRCVETLGIIMESIGSREEINMMKELREFSFGQAEEKDAALVWDYTAKYHGYDSGEDLLRTLNAIDRCSLLHLTDKFDAAENRSSFMKRVKDSIEIIVSQAILNGHEKILVVSHGITILGILELCGLKTPSYRSFENLSCTKIEYESNTYEVKYTGKLFD